MRKRIAIYLVLIMIISLLTGCGQEQQGAHYKIYYLNIEGTKLEAYDYVPRSSNGVELADELLEQLASEPDSPKLRHTIPTTVQVNSCSFSGYSLFIDFSEEYYNMSAVEELLVRAAVVKTMLQLDGIYYVSFTVDSEPLQDKNGALIGSMDEDSFVENPGEQINSSIETTLTLYFASADGNRLVQETRSIHYSSNISLEKLVIEQLIEGPKVSGALATLSAGTQLLTISTVDGVCYVNFDDTLQNQNYEIPEQVVLYSIVDSLTELQNVEKVQISMNGDTKGKFRFDYNLDTMYERNDALLQVYETNMESTQE